MINLRGNSETNWLRDRVNLELGVDFSRALSLATYRARQGYFWQTMTAEQWIAFATVNARFNQSVANNDGSAADAFGMINPASWWVDVAVRDTDAWIYRLGYHFTVYGTLVEGQIPTWDLSLRNRKSASAAYAARSESASPGVPAAPRLWRGRGRLPCAGRHPAESRGMVSGHDVDARAVEHPPAVPLDAAARPQEATKGDRAEGLRRSPAASPTGFGTSPTTPASQPSSALRRCRAPWRSWRGRWPRRHDAVGHR